MDKNAVSQYILVGYEPKKNRSVEKNILFEGHKCCFVAIIVWAIFHFFAIFGDEPMRILPINLAIGLLIPIIVFFAIKLGTNRIKTILEKPDKTNTYIAAASTIGAIAGIGFARAFLQDAAINTVEIIFNTMCGFLILVFIFCSCLCYHKVYLIRKYCPRFQEKRSNV